MWTVAGLRRIQGECGQGETPNAHKEAWAAWAKDDKWLVCWREKRSIDGGSGHVFEGGYIVVDIGGFDRRDGGGNNRGDGLIERAIFQ